MRILVFAWIPLAAGLVLFWMRDRARFKSRIQVLSDQHRRLELLLNGFIAESEKITVQFSRLIPPNRVSVADSNGTEELARRNTVLPRNKPNGLERRHLVLGLAHKGRSVTEIADRLMIPSGEVELILNLNATKRLSLSTSA